MTKDSFQTVLDDESGYDLIFLTQSTRPFFGIQWCGWFFTYNTLPFGWKVSPFIYHTTGLLATGFFRLIGIPCLLYIDDRHYGQLQVCLIWMKGNMDPWSQRMNAILQLRSLQIFSGCLLFGETGLFSWSVKIYSDPGENCSIPGIYGGLLRRDFSFDS